MPSYKAGNGEYKDICFPVTKEFREQLHSAVLTAYQQAITQNQAAAPNQGEEQNAALKQGASQPTMQMGGM